jgi:hypothetical protein
MAARRQPETDLFGPPDPPLAEAPAADAPLADRLRPRSLSEVVGQDHLLGEVGTISAMLARGSLSSLILWGPPGVGKTTIARLLAEAAGLVFVSLSAVFCSRLPPLTLSPAWPKWGVVGPRNSRKAALRRRGGGGGGGETDRENGKRRSGQKKKKTANAASFSCVFDAYTITQQRAGTAALLTLRSYVSLNNRLLSFVTR